LGGYMQVSQIRYEEQISRDLKHSRHGGRTRTQSRNLILNN